MALLDYQNKQVEVQVTQEDLNNGVLCSSSKCPISLALARTTNLKASVCIHTGSIYTENKKQLEVIDFILPENASQFVCDFDDRKEVEPFSFTLKLKNIIRYIDKEEE